MKALVSRIAYVCLVLLLGATRSSGGFAPSFNLQYSAWAATDVVLVTEGEKIDGHFRVLKVLKGDLAEGDALFIPELAGFTRPETRTVARVWYIPKPEDPPPMVLSANSMILFLVRRVSDGVEHSDGSQIHWQPSSTFKDMRTSAVWLEDDRVFAFMQVIRPGPTRLVELSKDRRELLGQVSDIAEEHRALESASRIEEPKARAERAVEFVTSSTPGARRLASEILGGCGEEGLPALFDLLDRTSVPPDEVFESLALIGGTEVGRRFTELLNHELEFWRERGPALEEGWWNGKGIELNEALILRGRWGVSYQLLQRLQELEYEGARQVVEDFREFYLSLPQLSELDQLTKICDELLESFAERE